jgi:hypothetical protein
LHSNATQQPQVQAPVSFARQQLVNTVGHGSLFRLYLALAEHSPTPRISISTEPQINSDSEFPQRLNHYRRAPLKAQNDDFSYANILNQELTQPNLDKGIAVRFWQSLHPSPLSMWNKGKNIDPEVKLNCSWPTQLRLEEELEDKELTIEASPALLADIIPQAQQMLI